MGKATYIFVETINELHRYERVEREAEIEIGQGCTVYVGTDGYPYHVSRISDSGKTVWIKKANFTADKEGGHNYFSNQKWIITPNPNFPEERVSKRKDGRWKTVNGSHVAFGHCRAYQDPHF